MLKLMVMYFIGWFALYVGWRVYNCFWMLLEWLEKREEQKNANKKRG